MGLEGGLVGGKAGNPFQAKQQSVGDRLQLEGKFGNFVHLKPERGSLQERRAAGRQLLQFGRGCLEGEVNWLQEGQKILLLGDYRMSGGRLKQ